MKKLLFLFTLGLIQVFPVLGQTSAPAGAGTAGDYSVTDRGANFNTWRATHRAPYTELAAGLNYWNGSRYLPSSETVEPLPSGGAGALQGQHQIYFPYDIGGGRITMITPKGLQVVSQPLCISYSDGTNLAVISELTNAPGEILYSNQVYYPGAFTQIAADVLCTYHRASFESDIVFRECPPSPAGYGIDPDFAWLQIWTEFFSTNDPEVSYDAGGTQSGDGDPLLEFGGMQMTHGRAYLLGATNGATMDQAAGFAVRKTWVNLGNRRFLVEEVPYINVLDALSTLPVSTNSAFNRSFSGTHATNEMAWLPAQHRLLPSTNQMQLAKSPGARHAPELVWDYTAINSTSLSGYTFRGDSTYYISGYVNLTTSATFDAGTIIKFANSSSATIYIMANTKVNWLGTEFHPITLTCQNDDSVGQKISGSTGTPATIANTYLYNFNYNAGLELKYARFKYATIGLQSCTWLALWHSQFVKCSQAIRPMAYFDQYGTVENNYLIPYWGVALYNDLFTGCGTVVSLDDGATINYIDAYPSSGVDLYLTAENVTVDQATSFISLAAATYTGGCGCGCGCGSGGGLSGGSYGGATGSRYGFSYESGCAGYGYHTTQYYPTWISQYSQAYLTNCLFTAVSQSVQTSLLNTIGSGSGTRGYNNSIIYPYVTPNHGCGFGSDEQLTSGSAVPYQSSVAGNYYLAASSSYHGLASQSILPKLLSDLTNKTTVAPNSSYANETLTSVNYVLAPCASRDASLADIGFHYDPVDYLVYDLSLVNSTILLTNGIVIGFGNDAGLILEGGSTLVSQGTSNNRNYFVHYTAAQEQAVKWGPNTIASAQPFYPNNANAGTLPAVNLRLTTLIAPDGASNILYQAGGNYSTASLKLRDCELFGSGSLLALATASGASVVFANNLFKYCNVQVTGAGALQAWNNLFTEPVAAVSAYRASFTNNGTASWNATDNAFDAVTVRLTGSCNHNAYLNNANVQSSIQAGDVTGNLTWITGPLGNYYQPNNSALINEGSRLASAAGLYDYTVVTNTINGNEIEETNSTVDIGYHFVAGDAQGNPLKTFSNTEPDYMFDFDGNGFPAWELKWFGNCGYSYTTSDAFGNTLLSDFQNSVKPVIITQQPVSQVVEDYDTVTFTVNTCGNPNIHFQWYYIPSGGTITRIGTDECSYTIVGVQDTDAGNYECVVSEGNQSKTTSPAALICDSADPNGAPQTGDYMLIPVLGNRQDYTFKPGTTYIISTNVALYGNTTIMGGAVIKFNKNFQATGARLAVIGGLQCNTGPYNMAILTSVDDDSSGEIDWIDGNGAPQMAANDGAPYLDLTSSRSNSISNLRICFANQGVTTPATAQRLDVWDCQFYECYSGVFDAVVGGVDNLHNVLFAGCDNAVLVSALGDNITGEQVTSDADEFCAATFEVLPSPDLALTTSQATTSQGNYPLYCVCLTNSIILWGTVNAQIVSLQSVAENCGASTFTSEGSEMYYLPSNSTLRGAGTAGISSRLQTELEHKTTSAPISIAPFTQIKGSLTINPQAKRYQGGQPDYGYYYDALDYSVDNLIINEGSLVILPGTAIGVRHDYFPNGCRQAGGSYKQYWGIEGIVLNQGASLLSHGTPTAPIIFTSENQVQAHVDTDFAEYEYVYLPYLNILNTWKTDLYYGKFFGAVSISTSFAPNIKGLPAPSIDFRFTKFYLPPTDYHIWSGDGDNWPYGMSMDSSMYLAMKDCETHGGRIDIGEPTGLGIEYGGDETQDEFYNTDTFAPGAISLTNNLFENTPIFLCPSGYYEWGTIGCDMQVLVCNNLFKGADWLTLKPLPATAGNWLFVNNLFDNVQFSQDTTMPLDYKNNAYWQRPASAIFWNCAETLLPATDGNCSSANDVQLTIAPAYQNGALGGYYLPTGSPLFGAASDTPANLGLYHYTSQANQTKEGIQNPSGSPANIGLHYIAVNSSGQPIDTDGDGIPDYVENWHGDGDTGPNRIHTGDETDWNTAYTVTGTLDPYNAIYDNFDLAGDGLVGVLEQFFGYNPLFCYSPLNLSPAGIPSQMSGTVTIPLQVNANVAPDTPFAFMVDGKEANATVQNVNGNWAVLLDTTTIPNGPHEISLGINYPYPNGGTKWFSAFGSAVFVNINNLLTFNPRSSTFCDSLVIDAAVNNDAISYNIQVYDATSQTLLTTLSGSVVSGQIETSWNLMDGNQNIIATGPVTCLFTLTPSGGTPTSTITKTYPKVLHNPFNDMFTLAWAVDGLSSSLQTQMLLGMANLGTLLNGWYDSFLYPDYEYGILPDGASGNVNNPGGDLSFSFSAAYPDSKSQLLNALQDSGNFFYVGHGSPKELSPNEESLFSYPPVISATDIANALENLVINNGNLYITKPYKLVVLFACRAYSFDFASAFGILNFETPRTPLNYTPLFKANQYLDTGRSQDTVFSYNSKGMIPQAYVGWPVGVNRPGTATEVASEQNNIFRTFNLWQDNSQDTTATIYDCINYLAESEAILLTANLEPDGYLGVQLWELSGCRDLRITDRWP